MQEQSEAEKRTEQPPEEEQQQSTVKANGAAAEQPAEGREGSDAEEREAQADAGPAEKQTEPGAGEENAQAAEAEPAATVPRQEFDALEDRFKRAHAEVANIRRRTEREKRETVKFGSSRMASDLLPIHDNLKRALSSVDDAQRDAAAGADRGH